MDLSSSQDFALWPSVVASVTELISFEVDGSNFTLTYAPIGKHGGSI